MEIILAKDNNKEDWNNFVNKSEDSGIFHFFEWKKIFEDNYGLKTFYIVSKDDNCINGILPLVFFKSSLTGRFFVSFPVSEDSGICAEDDIARSGLLKKSIEIAREEKADYIEFRHNKEFSGLATSYSKVTMRLQLNPDYQQLWKGFDGKVRNQIRKAERSGLSIKIGGAEDTDRFYDVFAVNMRDLGIPAHSRRFFIDVSRAFEDKIKIFSVLSGKKTVASGFLFCFKNKAELVWASSLRKFNKLCPNHLLYWEMLKYACGNGCKTFNFGRSFKESSTFKFKKQWQAVPDQLYWQYYLLNGDKLPDTDSRHPRYALAVRLWKKMPVCAVKIIGPRLMRILRY